MQTRDQKERVLLKWSTVQHSGWILANFPHAQRMEREKEGLLYPDGVCCRVVLITLLMTLLKRVKIARSSSLTVIH